MELLSETDRSDELLTRDDVYRVHADHAVERLGRNLAHLVNTVCRICRPAASWACECSPAKGRRSTPRTAAGRLMFGIFAALAEFERELIRERIVAGLKAARARGRRGGRKFALTKAQSGAAS